MVNLRENEKIIQIKRRHVIVLIMTMAPLVFFFIIGIIGAALVFFIPFSIPEALTDTFPFLLEVNLNLLTVYIITIFLIIAWQALFILFANYYLDCWIITNERTIHTELKSLFNRTASSVPHTTIQDITVNLKGFIPTILKYGNLQIQTAGKFHEFIFKQIPEPQKTKEIIFKAQKELQRKERFDVPTGQITNLEKEPEKEKTEEAGKEEGEVNS